MPNLEERIAELEKEVRTLKSANEIDKNIIDALSLRIFLSKGDDSLDYDTLVSEAGTDTYNVAAQYNDMVRIFIPGLGERAIGLYDIV